MCERVDKYYISAPVMSPVGRIVAGILAIFAVIGTIIFGFFVLALLVGVAAILMLVGAVRRWWLRHHQRGSQAGDDAEHQKTIEAEYTVISRRRD